MSCSKAMRLILVKPTNATRRLDSTGEVFQDRDREHFASTGSDKKHDPYSEASGDTSSSLQEKSQCCALSSLCDKSNGISPPKSSALKSPLKNPNFALSQLSDQDWLLLCDQVSSTDDNPPSVGRTANSVGRPNHNSRCVCPCPDALQHSETYVLPQSNQGSVRESHFRTRNQRSISSPHARTFSQSTRSSTSCFSQHANHKDLQKTTANFPRNIVVPQCTDQEAQREPPCSPFKLKGCSQVACPNLFNIPLQSIEGAQTNKKIKKEPQIAVSADVNWKELLAKEPLLVQQRQKRESHSSKPGDPSCKSSEDLSFGLKCRHLPYSRPTNTQRSYTPTSQRSLKSFSTSQCSLLENQDPVEEPHVQVYFMGNFLKLKIYI